MNIILKSSTYVLMGILVILVGLYAAGYQVKITSRGDQQIAQGGAGNPQIGTGKGTPGWRKAQGGDPAAAGAGPGSGQVQGRKGGAAGGNQAAVKKAGGAGSGQGQGRGQNPGGRAQAGQQPGFGPSGGILLPIKAGLDPVPVMVNGKKSGSFVGKDLMDHVEDTVVATAEGPRKGWGVAKTLDYLGVKGAKEVSLYDKSGKKITVSGNQIMDTKTFVLFTYDDQGRLLLTSGPKVRGTNKGTTSLQQVLKMVEGRSDLLAFPDVVKIEVKS